MRAVSTFLQPQNVLVATKSFCGENLLGRDHFALRIKFVALKLASLAQKARGVKKGNFYPRENPKAGIHSKSHDVIICSICAEKHGGSSETTHNRAHYAESIRNSKMRQNQAKMAKNTCFSQFCAFGCKI